MFVEFVKMEGPSFHVLESGVDAQPRELWPTIVTHALEGHVVQMRFAYDRERRVIYVDQRWDALRMRPMRQCKQMVVDLAKAAIREAATQASQVGTPDGGIRRG